MKPPLLECDRGPDAQAATTVFATCGIRRPAPASRPGRREPGMSVPA